MSRTQYKIAVIPGDGIGKEVLPAVRVLSVGAELGLTSDGKLASQPKTAEEADRKSTRLNSSHYQQSRMPSSA